jgi:radical SAM superfamily enzyme YgiQ (UPF0313 family)
MNDTGTIVLVNPPSETDTQRSRYITHLLNTLPQLGIAYLAASMRKRGFSARVLDAQALGLSHSETINTILSWSPDMVGCTGYTSSIESAHRISEAIKKTTPETTTVVGGPHVTAVPKMTLSRYPLFDFGLQGEGEITLPELAAALRNGASPAGIPGLVYREGDRIVVNERPPLISNLDTLPPPAFDLFVGFPKSYRPPVLHSPRGRGATLVTSRGCPFSCIFCDRSLFGEKYRTHSVDYIIEMISRLKRDYNIKHIIFYDDNFTARKKHLRNLLEKIMGLPFPITWNCDARADQVDTELLADMKRAGAWMINYGVETANEELLKFLNKSLSLDRVVEAVHLTKEAGIRVKGLFMIGIPGETEKTIANTKAFLSRLPFDFINISKFTPYPGCEIYRNIQKYGEFEEEWSRMSAFNFVFWPSTIDRDVLIKKNKELLRDFYRDRRIGREYARMLFRNPHDSLRLLWALVGLLIYKVKNYFSKGEKDDMFTF